MVYHSDEKKEATRPPKCFIGYCIGNPNGTCIHTNPEDYAIHTKDGVNTPVRMVDIMPLYFPWRRLE